MSAQFGKVLPRRQPLTLGDWLRKMAKRKPKSKPRRIKASSPYSELNKLGHREADIIDGLIAARGIKGVSVESMTASPIAGYIRYSLRKPPSVPVSKVMGLRDDIAIALTESRADDDDVQVNIRTPRLEIEVEYPFERKPLGWDRAPLDKLLPGQAIVGRDYNGRKAKPVIMDLSSKEVSNTMIAALPGAGKSQAVVQMVMSAAFSTSPAAIKFIVLDPKHSREMRALGQLTHAEFISEPEACADMIYRVREEIERRKHNDDTRTIVLVIDELSEFCSKRKEHAEPLPVMRSIARMGRSFGIKIIAATQYPTVDATDSELRAMLDARLGGHVGSETQSRVCMDVPGVGCEYLPKRGAFYYKDGDSKIHRINTHYLPAEDMIGVVNVINERWAGEESFYLPEIEIAQEEAAESEQAAVREFSLVTEEQLERIDKEYDIRLLINEKGDKLNRGYGAELAKFIFGENVNYKSREYRGWLGELVVMLKWFRDGV